MTQQDIIDYCLTKSGAYIDFPFGSDVLIIKVKAPSSEKGRVFAQFFELQGQQKVTFSCDRENGLTFRELFPDNIQRGWHCPPVQQPYFNTVTLDGLVPEKLLKIMADHAYEAVVAKMPKYLQKELKKI